MELFWAGMLSSQDLTTKIKMKQNREGKLEIRNQGHGIFESFPKGDVSVMRPPKFTLAIIMDE